MQLDELREKYPDAPDVGGWVEIYLGSMQVDGSYYASELRAIADFAERVAGDFILWYGEIRKIDPEMSEEPVNAFWHDFCRGKTPAESYQKSGMYGKK